MRRRDFLRSALGGVLVAALGPLVAVYEPRRGYSVLEPEPSGRPVWFKGEGGATVYTHKAHFAIVEKLRSPSRLERLESDPFRRYRFGD